MVFPDLKNEIKISGAWVDVTNYSYTRDTATIKRGRPDEWAGVLPPPSTLNFTLNNAAGRFSPRNPLSPYFGVLGRNTPIRSSVPGDGTVYCRLPGKSGVDNISTPDNAALHITGDIDIRVDVSLDNWYQYQTLAGRWRYGGTANSWILYLGGSGSLRLGWSITGSDAINGTDYRVYASTAQISATAGSRLAVRATLAVATGVVTFYTAPTIAGSWTQLGATTGPGAATTLFAGTEPLILAESGQGRTQNSSICAGRVNAVQVLSGIGGTAKANPDFTAQSVGTTSFTDASGRAWTLNGDCEITDRQYRFHGEISSLPPRWDTSGNDSYIPLIASGILRRLGQGSEPVTSALKRAITSASITPMAYWPAEDLSGSTSIASASNARNMTISGSPSFASDTHIGGSAALATLSGSTWTGIIPAYAKPSPNAFELLFAIYLNTAPANNAVIARAICGSTRFDLCYTTASGGGAFLNAYDVASGAVVGTDNTGIPQAACPVGAATTMGIECWQSGADFIMDIWSWPATGGGAASGQTMTSRTLGTFTQVVINPNGTLTDTAVGHITAYKQTSSTANPPLTFPPQTVAISGNAGETAANRFVRLCQESGVQPRTWGDPNDSPAMGGQGSDTLQALLTQCLQVDGGLCYEPRDILALGLRTRSSLFDETSTLNLSHSGGQLAPPLEPTDDDQLVRNDWTFTNSSTGNGVRATLDSGAMSTLDPPNGVGRYADQLTVNLQTDGPLADLAAWAVHVGTVNEQRYPAVTVQLESAVFGAASGATSQAIQKLDIGQVATLTGMPAWMPPDDSRQLIQGTSEVLAAKQWSITYSCAPASPYDVMIVGDTVLSRIDTDGSSLHANITSSASSFQVDVTGALWTTTDTPFDILMGGERMTVGAVSGASSPQTFSSVVRSVNGVVKAHSANEDIRDFTPYNVAPY